MRRCQGEGKRGDTLSEVLSSSCTASAPTARTCRRSARRFSRSCRTRASSRPTRRNPSTPPHRGGNGSASLALATPMRTSGSRRRAPASITSWRARSSGGVCRQARSRRPVRLLARGDPVARRAPSRALSSRAVVAASGRLATTPGPKPAVATPVLLLHGDRDQVVPPAETVRAKEALSQAGFSVEAHVYPGLGHSISPEGLATAGRFLAKHLPGAAG